MQIGLDGHDAIVSPGQAVYAVIVIFLLFDHRPLDVSITDRKVLQAVHRSALP